MYHLKPVFVASILLVIASIACLGTSSPIQAPPITQVVQITQIVPVTQIVPATQIMPITQIVPNPRGFLNVSYLGQDGSKLIGSGCPGTDYQGVLVDTHLRVSGIDSQKSIERIDVNGNPGTPHWESPCQGIIWGLAEVQEAPGQYSLYFAPVPNIFQYEVTVQYTDGSSKTGTVSVP
jgi:hypothetical protein